MSALQSMNYNGRIALESLHRISTGYRINSAADGAASLAISEKLRAQANGFNIAGRNIMDGVSLLQTAEGGLQQTTSMLQRMREITIQASTDTLTNADRAELDLQYQQLKEDITKVATTTEFNTKALLKGDYATQPLKIQSGANSGQTFDLLIGDMSAAAIGFTADSSIATREGAQAAVKEVDAAIGKVSTERASLGAYQNSLQHAYDLSISTRDNLTAAQSRIMDVDLAKEVITFTRAMILEQTAQLAIGLHSNQASSILRLLMAGEMYKN